MTPAGMKPDAFRNWRKTLGWKQKDAADRLGLKKRVIQYYEKGARDGKDVDIPKSVELACLALALGYEAYDGEPVERIVPAAVEPLPAEVAQETGASAENFVESAETVAPVVADTADEPAVDGSAEAKPARRARKKG